MSPELKKLITDLAGDVRETVEKIESGIKTTQNNYGRYAAILASFKPANRHVMALALIEAGANSAGVRSALKVI